MGEILVLIFTLAVLIVPFLSLVMEVIVLWAAIVSIYPVRVIYDWGNHFPRIKKIIDWLLKYCFIVELILYLLCFGIEAIYMDLAHEVVWGAGWETQLINRQIHQPINTEYISGVIIVMVIFFAGMIFLNCTNANNIPPLLLAISFSALYLGSIYSVIWTIHILKIFSNVLDLYLLLLPINTILISLRIIVLKSYEYSTDPSRSSKIEESAILNKLSFIKNKALYLPFIGLLLVIPLIGVISLILCVLGQAPDAAIKAFTETSDFTLSTKISPQNLTVDEHYLCTVAAGGDRKIVKPIRKGIRHGHEVIVNRQLQIANAFEDVLMDYTPRAHKVIRHIYDTYGFPIAKLIKKKWVADLVYFIMKPLEIIFLFVLYMTCVHPEDRIAMQYTGKKVQDIL